MRQAVQHKHIRARERESKRKREREREALEMDVWRRARKDSKDEPAERLEHKESVLDNYESSSGSGRRLSST